MTPHSVTNRPGVARTGGHRRLRKEFHNIMGQRPFTLHYQSKLRWLQTPARWLTGCAEHCARLDQLNRVYDAARRQPGRESFQSKVLRVMDVAYAVAEQDLQKIPQTGTTIVVANHPFGMLEGLVLLDILQRVRSDIRILANYMLGRIAEMRDLFILVDPFSGQQARAVNVRPMQECLRWLRHGGVLGVFPAGEVAHWDLNKWRVQDPPWTLALARLVRRTQAVVVPVFFAGANGPLFQLAGMLHPRLRTALLPRELLNKRHATIRVQIGAPIPFAKTGQLADDGELVDYLRMRTDLLVYRGKSAATPCQRWAGGVPFKRRHQALAAAVPSATLAAEVAALPPECNLIQADAYNVYCAGSAQIPCLLREIGRLRELTFRQAHEGSGLALDLDRFDNTYLHMFLWHVSRRELVGAYRIGQADIIVRQSGVHGLYSNTLFKYDQRLLAQLNPTLELGRSFIRPEYQRAYNPLFLLWKGIGAYIARNPSYTGFFGPVSINNAYRAVSRHLLVRFLERNYCAVELACLVQPRRPFAAPKIIAGDQRVFHAAVTSMADITALVEDIEQGQKGLPILLKQYIKLGGRFLAFNLDPAFSHVLDGLIWVDLRKTDQKIMCKYMGLEACTRWRQLHSVRDQAAGRDD